MKFLKYILNILLVLFLIVIITAVVVFTIDYFKTDYLDIESNKAFKMNSYVIKNVNVVPMTSDTVLRQKHIVIKNGKINDILDKLPKTDLNIIDANQKYISPGLIDAHVHIWDKQELGLYLANGVTAVRNAWGMPFHLRLKKKINANKLLAPLLITTTPKLTGVMHAEFDQLGVKDAKHAQTLLSKYKVQGYDLIKTYAGMPSSIFDAVLLESEKHNMPIVAHPSFEVPYSYHFKKAIQSIEHTEDIVQNALHYKLDSVALKNVVKHYAAFKAVHTPTLSIYQNIIDIIENKDSIITLKGGDYMNPSVVKLSSTNDYNKWTSEQYYKPETLINIKKQHQFHLYIVKQLHDAGVVLLCGTDSGIVFNTPGFTIHEELAYFLEAGLSPYEALKTATVNPSNKIELFNNLGTIEIGKKAHLILSDKNPLVHLESLKNPRAVFVNGRYLKRNNLNVFKTKAKRRKTGAITLIRFLESLL
ncbi:amidohydrolase family protein [Postechiella marina]|uniref:Amidohydrolase family protein n=1 Tax=Postechiella marina TaxID=943941 RepID=A0ABP8CBU9_9FLAO